MPRNVGSIEVTVDADTGKLKAQVTAGAKAAGKAAAKELGKELSKFDQKRTLAAMADLVSTINRELDNIDDIALGIDSREARARVKELREQIEATSFEVDLDAVLTGIETKLRELREKEEADALNLKIGLDVTEANQRLAAWKQDHDRDAIDIRLGADIAAAEAKIDEAKAQAEADAINLNIQGDVTKLNERIAAFRTKQETDAVDVELNPQLERANAAISKWRKKHELEKLNIALEADVTAINASMAEWRRKEEQNAVPISLGLDLARANAGMDEWRRKEESDALELTASLTQALFDAAAEADAFRLSEEADDIAFKASLTASLFDAAAEAEAFRLAEEADEIEFKASLTTSLFDAAAEAEAFRLAEEQDEIKLKASLTASLFTAAAEMDAFELEQEQKEIELKVGLRTKAAQLEALVLVEKLNRLRAKMEIDPNIAVAKFERSKLVIDRLIGEVEAEIVPDIKGMKWFAAKEKINTFMEGAGGEAGGGFTSGLSRSLQDGGQIAVAAIAAWGPGIAQGIEGLGAASLAVLSSGLYAVAGGAGALAGVGAAAGASLAAILVGSKGVPEALKAINTEFNEAKNQGRPMRVMTGDVAAALQGLTPEAKNFALAFAGVRDRFSEVREKVQEGLFEGLDQTLKTFVQTTLPDIEGALVIAAGSMNRFFKGVAQAAEQTDWSGTMLALKPALDNAGDAVVALAGTLGPFLKTTAPAAEELTGWLEDGAEALRKYVIKNPQQLTDFFSGGVDSLKLLVQGVGHFGDALADIFGAGKGPGDHFLGQLDNVMEKWNTFLEGPKGKDALTEFFEKGQQAIIDIQPIVDSLKEAWEILTSGDGNDFGTMMQQIADAIPGIAEILQGLADLNLGQGISNTVQVLGGLSEIFQKLPDGVKEFAGQLLVVTRLTGPLNSGIMAVAKSMDMMGAGIGIVAGLNLALTAGLFIWEAISGDAKEKSKNIDALTSSLEASFTTIQSGDDDLQGVAISTAAWNDALANTGDTSTDLRNAMKPLNQTMDDARSIVEAFQGDSSDAADKMEELRDSTNLAGDGFHNLGFQLANLNTAGKSLDETQDRLWGTFGDAATAAGISRDEFDATTESMWNMQETAEKVDMRAVAVQAIDNARTSGDAALANLELARSHLGLRQSLDEVVNTGFGAVELFDEYMAVTEGTTTVVDENTAATARQVDGMFGLTDASSAAEMAAEEHAAALKEERDAAYDAYQAEQQLATIKREQSAIAIRNLTGIPRDVTESFADLGDKVRDAADAGSAFQDVYDRLFGAAQTWPEALSGSEEALDKMIDLLDGVTGKADENSETMDGWSERVTDAAGNVVDASDHIATGFNLANESGRALQASAFDMADSIIGIGKAGIESGEGIDVTIGKMQEQRDAMHEQLVAFGLSDDAATEYINTLLGTPESMRTIIENPNLLDAMTNIDELNLLYDEAGKPVITEFEELGLDPSLASSQEFIDLLNELTGGNYQVTVAADIPIAMLGEFEVKGQQIDGTTWTPAVSTMQIDPAIVAANGVTDAMAATDDAVPAPVVDTSNITPANDAVAGVQQGLTILGDDVSTPGIEVAGAPEAQEQIGTAESKLDDLDKKKAEPTIDIPSQIVAMVLLAIIHTELTTINNMTIKPQITLPTYDDVTAKLIALSLKLAILNAYTADPGITLNDYPSVKSKLDTLQTEMNGLSGMVASPAIRLDGYDNTMQQIDNIQANLMATQDRTVTLRTNNVTVNSVTGPGSMAGSIVNSDQLIRVGERGLREAIVPLQLPLNRVNPEVREMAALLRGDAGASAPNKVARMPRPINQYFTLTSADPEAVAVQTLNRAAAAVG